MSCVFCGGKVVSRNVTFVYEHGEQLLVIRGVPAEVCAACGERTYSPEITDEIMKFAKQRFQPVKLIQVPVFDYGHKEAAAG
ncbi:MAG: type II toxin-antitoxin system MqsA family antitoxin [Desulfosalsimonadaceae bacterium]